MLRPFCLDETSQIRLVGRAAGGAAGVGDVSPNQHFALALAARVDAIMVLHVEPEELIPSGTIVRVPVRFPSEGVVVEMAYAERLTGQFWDHAIQIWTPTNDDATFGYDDEGHPAWLSVAALFGSVVVGAGAAARSVSRPRPCAYHVRDEHDTWTVGFRNDRRPGYYCKPQLELHFVPLRGNEYDTRFRTLVTD